MAVITNPAVLTQDILDRCAKRAPEYDRDVEPDIKRWFEDGYSVQYRNYPVDAGDLNEHEVIR